MVTKKQKTKSNRGALLNLLVISGIMCLTVYACIYMLNQNSTQTKAKDFMKQVIINEGVQEENILGVDCTIENGEYGTDALCTAPILMGSSNNVSFYNELKGYVDLDKKIIVWIRPT